MGKTPTDVENVYRIDMKGGKSRLWCGVCKKFLSEASGGIHSCDPNWRARLSRGRSSANASGRKRRYKMTPARGNKIKALVTEAVKYALIKADVKKLVSGKPKHPIIKKLSSSKVDKKIKSYLKSLGL